MSTVPDEPDVDACVGELDRQDPATVASGVRAVVFDLDGTLYEGEAFLPVYLDELGVHTGIDLSAARTQVEAILVGQHQVGLGDLYDPRTDRILRAPAWRLVEAVTWDGQPVDDPRIGRAVTPAERLTYLGDAWQVVRVVAEHLGAPLDGVRAAFRAVREAINADPDRLLDTSALPQVLAELHRFEHRSVLTNTTEELGRDLVAALGLDAWFETIRYGARKPAGTEAWLQEVIAELDAEPDQVLCIGDNHYNDVLPAVRSGCRAVWVDPYGLDPHRGPEVRVDRVAEVAALLRGAAA
ncbi:MAG: HAD family hydrolase [Nitriliruptoraceae bacterium]